MATAVASNGSNITASIDAALFMGGIGESASAAAIQGYTSAFASLIQPWHEDPRALWSSFAMIIVRLFFFHSSLLRRLIST